jgi:hypothetical protein
MKISSAGSSMTSAEVQSQTKSLSYMKEIKMHIRMKEG